jgi:peroxiredoxin
MQRLTAFEAKLPQYHGQNVQVLGVTVDDPTETAIWVRNIGVTFPIVTDKNGEISKAFELFDVSTQRSAKALALVHEGRILHIQRVTSTDIPAELHPWIQRFVEKE